MIGRISRKAGRVCLTCRHILADIAKTQNIFSISKPTMENNYMHKLRIKWGIIIKAFIIILPLVAIKTVLHFLNLEIIAVGPVITALVAGVFFVIAIILSGVLADYKESEKIPGELAASIEALYKDSRLLGNSEAVNEISN
jgi:uncharacterized membrane protein